jgi:molybdopterin/thiamine biosynthesis adenylyltransferase
MKNEARHNLIKGWNQNQINKATVVIGGCGAVGSQTAVTLARIGIGRIIAVDNDVLEEHNIFNQIYQKKQIGKGKVIALKEIFNGISETEFIGLKAKIQDAQLSQFKPTVFLGCFDNIGARFYLNYIAISMSVPYVDAGIKGYSGSVRTILPLKTPCLQCWPPLIMNKEVKAGCSNDPIPSTYFTASYASNLQVMQLVKLIFKKQSQSWITFDLEKGITNPIKLERNRRCTACEHTI